MMSNFDEIILNKLHFAFSLFKTGDFNAARIEFENVISISPGNAVALHLLGITLTNLGELPAAIICLSKCVDLVPNDPKAYNNLANAFKSSGKLIEALNAVNKAMALQKDYVVALCTRASIYTEARQFETALLDLNYANKLSPNNVDVIVARANALIGLEDYELALLDAHIVLRDFPDHIDALTCAAVSLLQLQEFSQAMNFFGRAIALAPDHRLLASWFIKAKVASCDWSNYDELITKIGQSSISNQTESLTPLALMTLFDRPDLHLASARSVQRKFELLVDVFDSDRRDLESNRIKIAYISADFRDHPVSLHIIDLLEHHDRTKFEVYGVAIKPDDGSSLRRRIEVAFEYFVDMTASCSRDISDYLNEKKIDILIDLTGLTQYARPEIFHFGSTPISVNYLGFPGTMGSDVYDYIIGDNVVTPLQDKENYIEKIVQLPNCFFPIGRSLGEISDVPSKSEEGLPDHGFIFACFNNASKISPAIFDVWMRLLIKIEDSVLWLQVSNNYIKKNLKKEATARGVDVNRLIFAKRVSMKNHLERHVLADLFLDTFPYNAHSTAAFALYAGLPVLTLKGKSFASRVSASMLTEIGVPELICEELFDYENKALSIASNPSKAFELKLALKNGRITSQLFDSSLITKNLETAFLAMIRKFEQGLRPDHIIVR